MSKRLRLLLHGEAKVGKSSLAETCVGPRLILDAEGGMEFLANPTVVWQSAAQPPPEDLGPNDSVVLHVKEWSDVELAVQWIRSGKHPFKSLVLDSLTEIQKQVKRNISSRFQIQDWGELLDTMEPYIREMRDLTTIPENPLWTLVIVAHSRNDDDGKHVLDLQGALSRHLPGFFDTVGYLRPAIDGSGNREMVVSPQAGILAGDRTKILRRHFNGVVPIALNDETEEITWNLTQLLELMNQ